MASIAHWKRHINSHLLNDPVVAEALDPDAIERNCHDLGHRWRRSFWAPSMTILTFLLQVLDPSKTLRAAVSSLLTHLAIAGQTDLPSADPTAYCQSRRRLPVEALMRLLIMLTERMRQRVDTSARWLGRRMWVADGSSAGMPDEPELQQAFPQPPGQKPGCGFPVAQFVALFCWATGGILDIAIDSIRPHELTLFRKLWHHFSAGDVVLADRAYGAYTDIAGLLARGVHCVFRLHQRRPRDFRAGRRLGRDDRLVTWTRPSRWLASCGLSREAFEQLPDTLTVRLVRVMKTPRGFRSRTIVIVTTLLDPVETPAAAIRELYGDRWTVELNLRSLKISLGMDVLRGRSVDVVTKEIAMHLVAYNLIRLLMCQAAREHGRDPHRLSFAGTLHRLHVALPLVLFKAAGCPRATALMMNLLLQWIARDLLPHRPNRHEPRRLKRRPKQYSRLIHPRSWYQTHRDENAR
jgi:hypothetical protein